MQATLALGAIILIVILIVVVMHYRKLSKKHKSDHPKDAHTGKKNSKTLV